MILLQDVCHARKSGGEDGQLRENGGTSTRTPTHDATASTNHHINASTPRRRRTHRLSLAGEADLARPLRGTRRPLQRVPRRERRGPCTTPARDLQKAVSPFSHTIDASHAATLRGTTRSQNSVTPRTIAGYPCGDSARDHSETSHRPASPRLQDYLNQPRPC